MLYYHSHQDTFKNVKIILYWVSLIFAYKFSARCCFSFHAFVRLHFVMVAGWCHLIQDGDMSESRKQRQEIIISDVLPLIFPCLEITFRISTFICHNLTSMCYNTGGSLSHFLGFFIYLIIANVLKSPTYCVFWTIIQFYLYNWGNHCRNNHEASY